METLTKALGRPNADAYFKQFEAYGFEFGAADKGSFETHAPKVANNHVGGGMQEQPGTRRQLVRSESSPFL